MDKPLVSVIIPVYNVEHFLPKCLDSVINQTYKNIEIICVNDGATDNSPEILEEFKSKDSRIKIINQENGGLATARNTGFKNATGEFIYFLDSDDWISTELINTTLAAIQSCDADIAMFDTYNVYNENSFVPVKRVSKFIKSHDTKVLHYKDDKNIRDLQCMAWAKLYSKKFLTENNLQFPDGMRFGEDVPFWFSLLYKNPKIVFIDKYLYYYRKRSSSLTAKTCDLIDKQWNVYQECVKTDAYQNANQLEKAYILDYNTRMAVYNFSTMNSFELFLPYEKSLKKFIDEYRNYGSINLLKLRGYKLLKTRWIYTIGKILVLNYLKTINKTNFERK